LGGTAREPGGGGGTPLLNKFFFLFSSPPLRLFGFCKGGWWWSCWLVHQTGGGRFVWGQSAPLWSCPFVFFFTPPPRLLPSSSVKFVHKQFSYFFFFFKPPVPPPPVVKKNLSLFRQGPELCLAFRGEQTKNTKTPPGFLFFLVFHQKKNRLFSRVFFFHTECFFVFGPPERGLFLQFFFFSPRKNFVMEFPYFLSPPPHPGPYGWDIWGNYFL